MKRWILLAILTAVASSSFGQFVEVERRNKNFLGSVEMSGPLDIRSPMTVRDSVTLTTTSALILTPANVTLTSPTLTVVVPPGAGAISVTTDASMTGARLVGGTKGQLLFVTAGAGSNTIRWDDAGTTMALGANLTMTEGHHDWALFICTNAAGDNWAKIAHSDN